MENQFNSGAENHGNFRPIGYSGCYRTALRGPGRNIACNIAP